MITTKSVNELVNIFKILANANAMVNDFGFGPGYNLNTNERQYPIVWIEPNQFGAIRDRPGQGNFQVFNMGFNIYVVDRMMKGDTNFDDILSDTNFIMQTLITDIDQSEQFTNLGINTIGNISWYPIFEGGNDNYVGYKATIVLAIPNTLTPCTTP